MDCRGEEIIARFVAGDLPTREIVALDDHLVECADCRGVVAAVAGSVNTLSKATVITGEIDVVDAPSDDLLRYGDRLGRYVVRTRLGEGGMGVVYLARDASLSRNVAVKLLRPDRSANARARKELLREAQAMARLAHPNVVTVYDVGEHGAQVFVAMEFVDGGSLAQWLAVERRGFREVVERFTQAGRGLAAAHAVGLVHRDFKPANVLVGSDGRSRVTDFGLARPLGASQRGSLHDAESSGGHHEEEPFERSMTKSGVLKGTPLYMAPEQFTGGEVDARTDQFGFCVALYIALYGERPFISKDLPSLISAVTTGGPRAPKPAADIPPGVASVICRGLASDPNARFPSMLDLVGALELAVRSARSPAEEPRARPWLSAAAVAGVIAASFVVALAVRNRGAPAPPVLAAPPAVAQMHVATEVASASATPPPLPPATPSAAAAASAAPAPTNKARGGPKRSGASARPPPPSKARPELPASKTNTRPYDDAPMEPSFVRP